MSKRFTDSSKFRNPWYRKLTPTQKCVWEYFVSECDLSGIIELDFDAMSFHIGVEIEQSDLEFMQNKMHSLDDGKVFLASFVRFQQGELNIKNSAHKNIIKTFEKYDLPINLNDIDIQPPFIGGSTPLKRVTSNSKGNSKGKGNSKPLNSVKPSMETKKNPLWFEGHVIRLTESDHNAWLEKYGGTQKQFYDWLDGRDNWYSQQAPEICKGWFFQTIAAIAKMKEPA